MTQSSPGLAYLASHPDDVDGVPREAVPDLLSEIEVLRARLWGRLTNPSTNSDRPAPSEPKEDRMLDSEEVAEILGVSERYVWDHKDDWPFTRRISPRKLRFSERGLYRWLETRP